MRCATPLPRPRPDLARPLQPPASVPRFFPEQMLPHSTRCLNMGTAGWPHCRPWSACVICSPAINWQQLGGGLGSGCTQWQEGFGAAGEWVNSLLTEHDCLPPDHRTEIGRGTPSTVQVKGGVSAVVPAVMDASGQAGPSGRQQQRVALLVDAENVSPSHIGRILQHCAR